MSDYQAFLDQAIALATENAKTGGGGPFGAVVVKDGKVIATGVNQVTKTNDPSAHAEIVAIRAACKTLNSFQLTDCEIYLSCEPCPMCLGAIYWARLESVYYAGTHANAAEAGFDDTLIYQELARPPEARNLKMRRMVSSAANEPFLAWKTNRARIAY